MIRGIVRRVLGVPLISKLIGANVIIVVSAMAVQVFAFNGADDTEAVVALVALSVATVANLALVRIALRPIDQLEQLAERVSEGDFDARISQSAVADRDLARLGDTVNGLLDALAAERKRIRDLGAQVVKAQDMERARVARELHDSIAQTLAAVRLQLAAAARAEMSSETRNTLQAASGMISSAMDEVMNVSYSLHSRVAVDLGLQAALGTLARRISDRYGVDVKVDMPGHILAIPPEAAATLYRVAEEALRGLDVHPAEKSATVVVSSTDETVRMEVTRGGSISDLTPTADLSSIGIAVVRNRVLLAGGDMKIDDAPNGGMRVTAQLRILRAAS